MASIYGTNSSDALSATTVPTKSAGESISGSHILAIANAANAERARRGSAILPIPAGYYSGAISASRIAGIRSGVEVNGPAASQAYMGSGSGTNSSNGVYISGYSFGITGYDGYYGQAIYGTTTNYAAVADPTATTFPQVATNTGSYDYNALYAQGSRIRAVHINNLITLINNNRAQCTCNCNYCTCNCNYCTCNCNYACTCNCNYSDEQVKTQIEYM